MSRTPATLLGLAIGDALGQPWEFCPTEKIVSSGWQGGFVDSNVWKLKAGQWTDDTKMALCIANSLVNHQEFKPEDIACRYVEWVKGGDIRGIGQTCERAIYRLSNGASIQESGKMSSARAKPSFKRLGQDPLTGGGNFCGNGTVMRAAPIGLFLRHQPERLKQAAKIEATITHDHPDARDTSYVLCYLIAALANGQDKDSAMSEILDLQYESQHVLLHILKLFDPVESFLHAINVFGNRGTAHETLVSALYCFLNSENFQEAIKAAVLMGGDTDTRAAITGAMAGTFYGLEGIPSNLVREVEESKSLQDLDIKLFRH